MLLLTSDFSRQFLIEIFWIDLNFRLAMLFFVVLQAACLLAVIEARPNKRNVVCNGLIDEYISYAYAFTEGSKEMEEMKQCVAKCAANANVSIKHPKKNYFPTMKELEPACKIQPCITDCEKSIDKSGGVSYFFEIFCKDPDYPKAVECMNENVENASINCLVNYPDNLLKTDEKKTEKVDPEVEDKKAVCQFFDYLGSCISEKMEGVCGYDTEVTFWLYWQVTLNAMKCVKLFPDID